MGYNNEFAATRSPLIFDCETAPLPEVRDYVDPPDLNNLTPPKNYKNQDAIDKWLAEEKVAKVVEFEALLSDKAALDYNTARIICLGTLVDGVERVDLLRCEADEREALRCFWATQMGRKLVGFRIRDFDLPMLIQRSRYLGVTAPEIDLGRYSRTGRIVDLFDLLTFQDSQRTFAMRRTLHAFCRRFGIPVADETVGADIAKLVADEKWGEIAAHCGSDIRLTKALAERLGVLEVKVSEPMPTTGEIVDKLRPRLQQARAVEHSEPVL
jgi:hypothetical protein